MEEYYKILEIQVGADKQQIRKAYKKQVRKYHPDVNPAENAHQRFIAIQEAYELLISHEENPFAAFKDYFQQEQHKEEETYRRQQEENARRRAQAEAARLQAEALRDAELRKNFTYIIYLGLILSAIWAIDNFIPSTIFKGKVVTYARDARTTVVTPEGREIHFTNSYSRERLTKNGVVLYVSVSPVLGVVKQFSPREKSLQEGYGRKPVSIHTLSPLYYLMLGCALLFLFRKEHLGNLAFLGIGLVNALGSFLGIIFYFAHSF